MSNIELTSSPVQSFWKRPEGKVGKWFNFMLIAGLCFFLYNYRTDITSFVRDLTHMIWACVGLAITLYVILDNKLRNLLSFIYMQMMRGVTGIFVEMDPVTAIKNKIAKMWEKRKEMGDQLVAVKGGLNRLQSLINENEKNRVLALNKMKYARDKGDNSGFDFASKSAARYEESNERMQPQLERLTKVYETGSFFYNNAENVIRDKEEDLNLKISEFEIMKSSSKLVSAAAGIFAGNQAEDQIYNQSYDFMMQSIANSSAELDVFVDSSKGVMSQINLENGAMSEKGIKMLTEFEQQTAGFTSLNGGKQPVKLSAKSSLKIPVQGESTYNDLLN